jgi:twitching motility protein PilU
MEMFQLLKLMVDHNASDLFLSSGAPPNMKVDGVTRPVNVDAFKPGEVKALAHSIMNERQMRAFEETMECNLSVSVEGIGRFRYNMYVQKNEVAMVVRYIKSKIPSFEALGLPPVLRELIMLKRGLVLIVGSAGSGKSTTLASMIDYRNMQATGHILCIEDPIEFMHEHKRSIVDQREVGIDTLSYEEALRNAMREAPDVIMIGEIRDRMTMQSAIAYAETGHLCVSTLHANNANQAIERIINFFPEDAQRQLFMDLSLNLKGVMSQRLIPSVEQKRQVLAVEVMLASAYISDLIQKGQIDVIKAAMAKSNDEGMKTFDQSLFDLYSAGKITIEEALRNADSQTDLAVRVRLTGKNFSSSGPALGLKPDEPGG